MTVVGRIIDGVYVRVGEEPSDALFQVLEFPPGFAEEMRRINDQLRASTNELMFTDPYLLHPIDSSCSMATSAAEYLKRFP
jgi:hypothetical protein